MVERLFIAGSGGQGIVLAGKIMATAAVRTVSHITYYPAYGAEVRGGTSNCQVILSTDEIPSPVTEVMDSMILMNQASADRFLERADSLCQILVNSSLCKVPRIPHALGIRASHVAEELGDMRTANMVMLGVYVAHKRLVPAADVEAAIRVLMARKNDQLADLNLRAFQEGMRLGRKH